MRTRVLFKNWIRIPAYLLLVTLVIAYFLIPSKKQNIHISEGPDWDHYNPELFYKLLTVDAIVKFNDSIVPKGSDKLDYIASLSKLVSSRFWHAYSYYTFRHNWISYTSGKLIWNDLNAIVIPNDILQYSNAACSQTSIVLASCLNKAGIPYRNVSLKGHFALEAQVNGKWYYLDPNLDPVMEKPMSLDEIISTGKQHQIYKGRLPDTQITQIFSSVRYSAPNIPIAPNATVFHKVTYIVSVSIPLILLAYAALDFIRMFRQRKKLLQRAMAKEQGKIVTFSGIQKTLNSKFLP